MLYVCPATLLLYSDVCVAKHEVENRQLGTTAQDATPCDSLRILSATNMQRMCSPGSKDRRSTDHQLFTVLIQEISWAFDAMTVTLQRDKELVLWIRSLRGRAGAEVSPRDK